MVGAPQKKLPKWFANLIELNRQKIVLHSLKDTFDFMDKIQNLNVSNTHMVSFDVRFLFTSVPLEEITKIIWTYTDTVTFAAHKLKNVLLPCTRNVQLRFDESTYSQIDSVAIGRLLGPSLADICAWDI